MLLSPDPKIIICFFINNEIKLSLSTPDCKSNAQNKPTPIGLVT